MLIVLEGIDGSGKTSVAADLALRLRGAGVAVVETREPWESEASRELQRIFSGERPADPRRELELFQEDRREHVASVVRPALGRRDWVVQDRTFYSTAAYQGARGIDVEEILAQSRAIAPEPDLVLLLAIEPEAALRRIANRRDANTSFEKRESLEAVDRIYRELASRTPNFVTIDATPSQPEVVAQAARVCRERLGKP